MIPRIPPTAARHLKNHKRAIVAGLILCSTAASVVAAPRSLDKAEGKPEWWVESMTHLDERMAWWEEARFALFIHWGAYSVLGGEYGDRQLKGFYAEHIARECKIPKADYIRDAASKFRPDAFDAESWVLLAKNAGMKYVVITAKHHDGFAIYDSACSDFDIKDTAKWDRDPLRELADSCKKHGLHFGVYYSHAQDWYEPGGSRNDWDFDHPDPEDRKWYEKDTPEAREHMKRMEEYLEGKSIPQIKELIQNYGVEMIWFDTPIWMPPAYTERVLKAVRDTNPKVIVSPRIFVNRTWADYVGGADSPSVFPMTDERYWEAIQSTLHSWGYNKFDEENRRPTDHMIRMLATVVSKGGNMMLNVGPKPDGTLVEGDTKTLGEIADWIADQSQSIHGAGKSPLPAQNWGVITQKDQSLFLHVFDWPEDGILRLGGLKTPIETAILMKGRTPLTAKRVNESVVEIEVPASAPHPIDSVIKLTCSGPPEAGDGARLLESMRANRLHVCDTAIRKGKRPLESSGRGREAYLSNWNDPSTQVIWEIRAEEPQSYQIICLYDVPKRDFQPGDEYQVTIGSSTLNAHTKRKGSADSSYIEREMDLMKIDHTGPTMMVADHLGIASLEPGVHQLSLQAAGTIRGKELFRPRAVILVPSGATTAHY